MCLLMFQSRAGRCVSFVARPFAAITSERSACRADDALARLDDGLLRDIGVDRCQIRYTPLRVRGPKPDHEQTSEVPEAG